MFDNIGEKIKKLAIVIFAIEGVAAFILGFCLIITVTKFAVLGFILMIIGPIVALISSWLLYGFGVLVEKVCFISDYLKCSNNTYSESTPEPHCVHTNPISTTFKPFEIMEIPKRNR